MSDFTSLITVIVPCFNHGKYLDLALQSVHDQTYHNWECIIVDDGSTDDTAVRANVWVQKDQRFRYFYQDNRGLSASRNKGIREMKGDFIQFLDSDDCIDRNKFLASLEQGVDSSIIISDFAFFVEKPQENLSPSFVLSDEHFNFSEILMGWDTKFAIPIHCAIFKASLFQNLSFNENLKAKEDWLMWLQIYSIPTKTTFIKQPFALYRMTPASMTRNSKLMRDNLVKAYFLIYEMLSPENKTMFFQKAVNDLSRLLENEEAQKIAARNSTSFRLGHFFIKRFKFLKSPK